MTTILLMMALLGPAGRPGAAPREPRLPGTDDRPAEAGYEEKAPAKSGAKVRKEARDKALARLAGQGLAFTMEHGPLAVEALLKCSPEGGLKLVRLFDSGEWARLRYPTAVLRVVAQLGDPSADWLSDHIDDLAGDPAAEEAWCKWPEDILYSLVDPRKAAARVKAEKGGSGELVPQRYQMPLVVGILVLAAAFLAWQRRGAARG